MATEKAVHAIGCGYDLSKDISLQGVTSRLLQFDDEDTRDVVFPGGLIVPNVPQSIRCDKGERTRFRSDVLSFHQMSEHFNHGLSLLGKIPSGLFNAMFDFRGSWQDNANCTQNLAYDACFVTLYSIQLVNEMVLHHSVKKEIPSTWDPSALAKFIKKYGTHIITGMKMGGKEAIHLKQLHDSSLQPNELQILVKKLADERFLDGKSGSYSMDDNGFQKKIKNHIGPSIVSHSRKHNIISVHIRRGGIDHNQSHDQWLSTVPMAPNAISMSFVPITSLLKGVPGSGFLTHAVNHYLRYKPPIEELPQFLEFQIPRQWAPQFGYHPLATRHRKQNFPSLRFSYTSSRLYIITTQIGTQNLPATGIRLHLEGVKNNHLSVHLQHLSALPNTLKISDDNDYISDMKIMNENDWDYSYYEPVRSSSPFSYVCTAPIQYNVSFIDDSHDTASIVTKCWLELKDINAKKVLFLRLGFSTVASAKIRRSEWDGPSLSSRKPIGFNSRNLQPAMAVLSKELNSALYPGGPPIPVRTGKMLKYVDTVESTRGPEDYPGYWVVTGAKLCVGNGKIMVKAKYSLLSILSEDENLNITF